MKLLINLTTPSELASYEGCALALTLATFGHEVQLYVSAAVTTQLMQPDARMTGMIQALELYDMPKAWLDADNHSGWLMGMLPDVLSDQLMLAPDISDDHGRAQWQDFDQILSF